MAERKLGGNISLIGFDVLEPMELVVIRKIVGNYVKKLSNSSDYESLKLKLKQHKKGKTFIHEINAELFANGRNFGANTEEWNLFFALTSVLDKILAEIEHLDRTRKEIWEERKKKQTQ